MKKWKRVLLVGMCTFLLTFTVMSTYQRANEVKAVIGVDDALILIALLASFGIVAGGYVIGNNAEELYNELEEGYDSTRFTLLEGGGGNPDDPEDDDDNINDENGDGKVDENDIPKFSALMDKYNLNGEIKFTASIIACLAPVIYKWYQSKQNVLSGADVVKGLETHPEYGSNSYPNYVIEFSRQIVTSKNVPVYSNIVFMPPGSCFYLTPDTKHWGYLIPDGSSFLEKTFTDWVSDSLSGPSRLETFTSSRSFVSREHLVDEGLPYNGGPMMFFRTNMPIYQSNEEALEAVGNQEPIWTTPELQDTFKNDGDFKRLPMRDPDKAYGIPTQQALQDLDNDMMDNNLTDDDRNNLINDFINNLKNPSDKPAPGADPDSPVDPDKPVDPDNPDKPVNPDNPGSGFDKGSLTADLSSLFPFCIPFDLIRAIKVFNKEPETPRFEWTLDIKPLNYSYTFVIDLEAFNAVAGICRSMFLLLFIFGLIMSTRALIKG